MALIPHSNAHVRKGIPFNTLQERVDINGLLFFCLLLLLRSTHIHLIH